MEYRIRDVSVYCEEDGSDRFVFDTTSDSRTLKFLTLVDEFTRECLAIKVGRRLPAKAVIEVLEQVLAERGVPEYLRSDNGTCQARIRNGLPHTRRGPYRLMVVLVSHHYFCPSVVLTTASTIGLTPVQPGNDQAVDKRETAKENAVCHLPTASTTTATSIPISVGKEQVLPYSSPVLCLDKPVHLNLTT